MGRLSPTKPTSNRDKPHADVVWTPRKEQLVTDLYGKVATVDLAERLGKTTKAVRVRAQKLRRVKIKKDKAWQPWELYWLRHDLSHRAVGMALHRSKSSVSSRRWKLGIDRTRK